MHNFLISFTLKSTMPIPFGVYAPVSTPNSLLIHCVFTSVVYSASLPFCRSRLWLSRSSIRPYYNQYTGQFDGLPSDVQEMINQDSSFQRALENAFRALGER